MDYFLRKNGVLHAEDVSFTNIAKQFGTPTYVYSKATIERHVRVLQHSLKELDYLICYAVKANGNLGLLKLLRELDVCFDAVSVGELWRVLKSGAKASQLILSGVGKRDDEIATALKEGVLYICAESQEEIAAIARIAQSLNVVANVTVRVNPDVDAQTHPYISTGLKQNKFGVPIERAQELYAYALTLPHVKMVGVTCHIGSQITELQPFIDAAERLVILVKKLQAMGVPLKHVGIGGGLGIPYQGETPPSPEAYGQALVKILGPLKLQVVLEPGRVIVGNAGVLLTQVVRQKQGSEHRFVLVDAGMNDLIRPALYEAFHAVETVEQPASETQTVDIVGPVCESADTFIKNHSLPKVQTGDLLILRSTGAYGFVMSSNYNGRLRPAEVLVDGSSVKLIRKRETYDDLWRGEE